MRHHFLRALFIPRVVLPSLHQRASRLLGQFFYSAGVLFVDDHTDSRLPERALVCGAWQTLDDKMAAKSLVHYRVRTRTRNSNAKSPILLIPNITRTRTERFNIIPILVVNLTLTTIDTDTTSVKARMPVIPIRPLTRSLPILTHPLTHPLVHSLTHLLAPSYTQSLTYSLTHSITRTHTHSYARSLMHRNARLPGCLFTPLVWP